MNFFFTAYDTTGNCNRFDFLINQQLKIMFKKFQYAVFVKKLSFVGLNLLLFIMREISVDA